jgi:hypothetical protein
MEALRRIDTGSEKRVRALGLVRTTCLVLPYVLIAIVVLVLWLGGGLRSIPVFQWYVLGGAFVAVSLWFWFRLTGIIRSTPSLVALGERGMEVRLRDGRTISRRWDDPVIAIDILYWPTARGGEPDIGLVWKADDKVQTATLTRDGASALEAEATGHGLKSSIETKDVGSRSWKIVHLRPS